MPSLSSPYTSFTLQILTHRVAFLTNSLQIHSFLQIYPHIHTKTTSTIHHLKSFSRNLKLNKYCLGHLFTHQDFSGGVLGLAYISNPKKYRVGGVCSICKQMRGRCGVVVTPQGQGFHRGVGITAVVVAGSICIGLRNYN